MELFSEVVSIINHNVSQPVVIRPQDRLREDLHIDSFDTMMIGCELEDHFHITIDPDEIKNLKVVQDIVDRLQSRVPGYPVAKA
jgi:acyl carrier protein